MDGFSGTVRFTVTADNIFCPPSDANITLDYQFDYGSGAGPARVGGAGSGPCGTDPPFTYDPYSFTVLQETATVDETCLTGGWLITIERGDQGANILQVTWEYALCPEDEEESEAP